MLLALNVKVNAKAVLLFASVSENTALKQTSIGQQRSLITFIFVPWEYTLGNRVITEIADTKKEAF